MVDTTGGLTVTLIAGVTVAMKVGVEVDMTSGGLGGTELGFRVGVGSRVLDGPGVGVEGRRTLGHFASGIHG